MRIHNAFEPYACDQPDCVLRFSWEDELKRHQRLVHSSASSRYEGALADTDQVVYAVHGRRTSDQYASSSSRPSASHTLRSHYVPAQRSSGGGKTPLPPRPATSMDHTPPSSYARQPPPQPPSSRRPVAQPAPLYPGGTSFMPPPPATPRHPPLPLQYHTPTTGRSTTPVTLPPPQSGYLTDSGRRERSVRLPGFAEVAGQQSRDSETSRNRYREREREREREHE